MQQTRLILLFSILILQLNAQVNFQTFDSLEALLKKSKSEKKNAFIQIESDECLQCSDVANQALTSSTVKEKFDLHFVSTKINVKSDFYKSLLEKFDMPKIFGSVFLNSEGALLYNMSSTTSLPLTYLESADKAMSFAAKYDDFAKLDKEYKNGKRSSDFLEKYIKASRTLERYSEWKVMDEYIGKLPADSLKSDAVIKFVQEQGLPINSWSYNLVRNANTRQRWDSIWYLKDEQQRMLLNGLTRVHTFREAVIKKDYDLMSRLSRFINEIYGSNWRNGEQAANKQHLDFLIAVKDTNKYLRVASNFAEYSLMRFSNDSIKAWDIQERNVSFGQKRGNGVRFVPPSNQYAQTLNNMAWQVYKMTNDTLYLNKALNWSKRAMEIQEDVSMSVIKFEPTFMDTHAHLLYKLGRFDEAIEWQTKAIETNDKYPTPSDSFKIELEKMRNRKL